MFWYHLGLNTDISSPTVFLKKIQITNTNDAQAVKSHQQLFEGQDPKGSLVKIQPMLIDTSIVDSIIAEKIKQEKQNGIDLIHNIFSLCWIQW